MKPRSIVFIIMFILVALVYVLALPANLAEAHGRGATAFPLAPQTSASGLKLSGVVTCTTVTAHAEHPDGQRALLAVWDITDASIAAGDQVILDSIIDYETSMMAWDDVISGHQIMVSVHGQEDGDSLQQVVTVPACTSRRR